MAQLLALDEGTTSARAILFADDGRVLHVAQREFTQHYPVPGWVEHDPEELWQAQCATVLEVVQRAGGAKTIAALGITNQRETTVIWNRRTGEPIHRALVWQDRRTAPWCAAMRAAELSEVVSRSTGLVIDAYFSASKIAWLLEHVPGARVMAERGELAFGTIDTWLIWKLTSGRVHVTDATNAARTMLLNIHTGAWDDDLLARFAIPRALLPEVVASNYVVGEVTAVSELAGIPIAGIAGDQQAALFGQMCLTPGQTKNTYGTGCFMLQNTGRAPVASRQQLLSTIAWRLGDELTYALEGSVFIGGAVVQWLRDGLGLIRSAAEVESLARSVPDSGGVLIVPAFAGLGAPHWDPYARGAILGITRGTTAAHLARAAIESIAFQVADLLDAIHADAETALPELRVDGGAAANDLLLQFQADVLSVPVLRPEVTETTALGAAYLAGLGVGVWRSAADVASQWRIQRQFEPQISPSQALDLRARWARAVTRAKEWEK